MPAPVLGDGIAHPSQLRRGPLQATIHSTPRGFQQHACTRSTSLFGLALPLNPSWLPFIVSPSECSCLKLLDNAIMLLPAPRVIYAAHVRCCCAFAPRSTWTLLMMVIKIRARSSLCVCTFVCVRMWMLSRSHRQLFKAVSEGYMCVFARREKQKVPTQEGPAICLVQASAPGTNVAPQPPMPAIYIQHAHHIRVYFNIRVRCAL